MKDFLYRLFFTRNDDLDLLQIFFLLAILFFGASFSLEAAGVWHPSATGWKIFERIFYLLALLGAPNWATGLIMSLIEGRNAYKMSFSSEDQTNSSADPNTTATTYPHPGSVTLP